MMKEMNIEAIERRVNGFDLNDQDLYDERDLEWEDETLHVCRIEDKVFNALDKFVSDLETIIDYYSRRLAQA